MVVCFCRVSSDTQEQDKQRAEIKGWLTNHQINPNSVAWDEDIEIGATLARPAFEVMKETFGK